MIAIERQRYILQQLREKGIINLKEITRELGISEITVRRDFEKLEKQGKLTRVLGGAALTDKPEETDIAELPMRKRNMIHAEEKKRVAEYAASLVHEGDSVFLDAGTTMVPLMKLLEKMHIKIVTYSQLLLGGYSVEAEIFQIGGIYKPYYALSVGPIAQEILKRFHFDIAFLGCSGIDTALRMCYTTEVEGLQMKQIAMENAQRSYMLLDQYKLGRSGFSQFASTDAFTGLICDALPADRKVTRLPNMVLLDEADEKMV